MKKIQRVVTYQSPTGDKIHICVPCEARLKHDRRWPRDHTGQEYCSVSHGLHDGSCSICRPVED